MKKHARCCAAVLLLCLLLSACSPGAAPSGDGTEPAAPQIAGMAVEGTEGLYQMSLEDCVGDGGCLLRDADGLLLLTYDYAENTGTHIFRMDPETGAHEEIAVVPDLSYCEPAKIGLDWEGAVVFSANEQGLFYVAGKDGQVEKVLYPEAAAPYATCFRSTDGSKIYYTDRASGGLWVYDTAGKSGTQLAELAGLSGIELLRYYEDSNAIAITAYDARRDLYLSCYYSLEDGALLFAAENRYTIVAAEDTQSVVFSGQNPDRLDCYDTRFPRMRRSIEVDDLINCTVGADISRSLILTSRSMTAEEGTVVFLSAYDALNGVQTGNLRWSGAAPKDQYVTVYTDNLYLREDGVAVMLASVTEDGGEGIGNNSLSLLQWDLSHGGSPSNTQDQGFSKGLSLVGRGEDDPAISSSLQAYKHELENHYGVTIYIGAEADRYFPDYRLEVVEDEELIQKNLEELEAALGQYPEGFFKQLLNDQVHTIGFYLGGRLSATNDYSLSEAGAFACVYGQEQILAFDLRQYSTTRNLYHEMAHAIDRKIEAAALNGQCTFSEDDWKAMNPPGFSYDYSYVEQSYDPAYTALSVYDRDYRQVYFIDSYAKTFPTEDRARLMEYLLSGEQADACFESPHLQEKLTYYFAAIREAFADSDWGQTAWEKRIAELQ